MNGEYPWPMIVAIIFWCALVFYAVYALLRYTAAWLNLAGVRLQ